MFWLVTVGLTTVIKGISYAGSHVSAPIIWWTAIVVVLVPVEVWWVISLWRCAENTNKKLWTVMARVVVVIAAANSAYGYFVVLAHPYGI